MSEYLIINILIIAVPLLMSFEKQIYFIRNIKYFYLSFLCAGIPFIVWDSIASVRGDWSFNPEFTAAGLSVIGLPPEELLFFLTVPYAVLFLYDTVNHYIKPRKVSIPSRLIFLFIAVLFIASFISYPAYYTFTVFLFSALILTADYFYFKVITESLNYLITIGVSYLPFVIVNYFLTSLPVVIYNEKAYSGIRITTIPAEDFLYSLAMLSAYIMFFEFFRKRDMK